MPAVKLFGSRRAPVASKEIGLFWWQPNTPGRINLGDEIGRFIVEAVSGRSVAREPVETCDLLSVGSILHNLAKKKPAWRSGKPLHVWGSGLIAPVGLPDHVEIDYASVRGPLTRCVLGLDRAVPLGDPGLLASEIWEAGTARRWAYGIIPHHHQIDAPYVAALLDNTPGSVLIDVTDPDIAGTLGKIAACERVASTSLHGLIFADSYHIPNLWLLSEHVDVGRSWKFFDYFASVGREVFEPVDATAAGWNLAALPDGAFAQRHFTKVDTLRVDIRNSFPAALERQ